MRWFDGYILALTKIESRMCAAPSEMEMEMRAVHHTILIRYNTITVDE